MPEPARTPDRSPRLFDTLLSVAGIHLLGLIGVVLALIGAAMMLIPRPLALVLRLLGMRWDPHGASRVAAWGLVMLGLVVVGLTRAVR